MANPIWFGVPLVAVAGALVMFTKNDAVQPFNRPELVSVPPGDIEWHPLGNFSRDGKTRDPQPVSVQVSEFSIMKYEVSRIQYAICVEAEACPPVPTSGGALSQTLVNWYDATAFAAWYSETTHEHWRLPTEAEWTRAAAEHAAKPLVAQEALDPGQRMLANYANGVFLRGTSSPTLRPQGGFGENSLGVADITGNVWEWTEGCMENGTLRADGSIQASVPYCGVRIAGGLHRAGVIDFVRDASVGGCAVGLPPDHLGFRLVRDPG